MTVQLVLALVVALWLGNQFTTALGIGEGVLDFVSPLPYPLNRAGLVVGIWFAIGIVLLIWLRARHPERIRETGHVFLEEPSEPAPSREVGL